MTNPTPTAFFMMGGPGSGKSFIRKTDSAMASLTVVDCDNFKMAHPDYDPKNPGALHEWSSIECTKAFYRALSGTDSFVYDGTGTNAEKQIEWMMQARAAGFRVEVVFVRCSLNVALARNAARERTVPEHIVIEKHAVVETSFRACSGFAHTTRVIDNS
jgi:predicted kinase